MLLLFYFIILIRINYFVTELSLRAKWTSRQINFQTEVIHTVQEKNKLYIFINKQTNKQANKQRNAVPFRLQANFTDWATAADRRILLSTFADRMVSHGERAGPPRQLSLVS
jgi:hypothetical protein